MAFKLKSGNRTSFKNMGSSPVKDMKTGKYEHSFESPTKQKKKVDPDAPGTPGKPGFEPPVRRSDFDKGSEQQKMFDANQAKSKAKTKTKNRPEPTYEGTDEYRKEKDIPAEDFQKKGMKKPPSKFLMKAAGMIIGANKRRQAGKDAQDKSQADAFANFGNKKLT